MKNSSGVLKSILAFVVIVGIGIGIGWLASRRKAPPTTPPPTEAEASPAESSQPKTPITMAKQFETTNEVVIPSEDSEATAEPADLTDKISDILGDDTEITNKVEQLLVLYPRLSPAGKLEAAEHLTNLVGDEEDEYAPLAKILTNDDVPPKVATHLLDDLINRPKSLMMPLYLKVAVDPNHPGSKEAKETLEIFLDEGYSEDPVVLSNSVAKWLVENPD